MKNLFLLIGAQKCGTTSIYEILKNQPGLVLTKEKESKYFLKDELYNQGLPRYERMFSSPFGEANAAVPFLDVDPDFFHFSHVPERIHQTAGSEVRFILVLRNPVDRAWSAWQMERFRKREKMSFEQAIAEEDKRIRGPIDNQRFGYLRRGLYFSQLQQYLRFFPLSAFRVYLFEEDFIRDRKKMFADLVGFMGLEASTALPLDLRRNPARKIRNRSFDKLLRGDNVIRKIVRSIISEEQSRRWKDKLYALNASQKVTDRLSAEVHDRIMHTYFEKDISALEELLERDLSVWTQPRSGS
ncbi:MAG: sulfotransferase domain-containing protein [Saprospiraceae bacterium]|nr:sulfotransferase domain-containing protein [Saprospiraceae bacterium]